MVRDYRTSEKTAGSTTHCKRVNGVFYLMWPIPETTEMEEKPDGGRGLLQLNICIVLSLTKGLGQLLQTQNKH